MFTARGTLEPIGRYEAPVRKVGAYAKLNSGSRSIPYNRPILGNIVHTGF